MAAVRRLGFLCFPIFYEKKIQICAYIFVFMQNLVKIGRSTAELLRIFDFQDECRPPSWIFIFPHFL